MLKRLFIFLFASMVLFRAAAEYAISPHQVFAFHEKILFNYYEEEVTERLRSMNTIVEVTPDEDVLSQVKRFVVQDRGSSKSILYRSRLYFPMMDRLLFDEDMPFQLKNLAVLESALNPEARSYAGAAGMWQLMPETARSLGLHVGKNLDERLDPVASTRAALTYLKKLYAIFNDWTLVLAAYNCGENKILSIQQETGLKKFEDIKKFLPKQTQLFIPTFIGASYLMEYYGEHDLQPSEEELPTQYLTYVRFDRKVSLTKLFKESGVSKEVFSAFNPSIRSAVIDPGKDGVYLCLPDSMMVEFVDYYLRANRGEVDTAGVVEAADHSLILELITFSRPEIPQPDEVEAARDSRIEYAASDNAKVREVPDIRTERKSDELVHVLKTGESLSDVADQYPSVTVEQLMAWNSIQESDPLLPGRPLAIRR